MADVKPEEGKSGEAATSVLDDLASVDSPVPEKPKGKLHSSMEISDPIFDIKNSKILIFLFVLEFWF